MGNCRGGKLSFGKLSGRTLLSGKSSSGKLSCGKLSLGKCRVGNCRGGKLSCGKLSWIPETERGIDVTAQLIRAVLRYSVVWAVQKIRNPKICDFKEPHHPL